MNKQILFASVLAVLGLTACEKTLVENFEDVGNGQVKNSLLQVRTRSGGSTEEETVSYPVTVYVFQGDECKATQTIGDEGADTEHSACGGSVFGVCHWWGIGIGLCYA